MFDRFGRGLYLQALLAIGCVAVVSQLPPSAEAGTSDPPPWGTTQPWIMPQAIYDDTTSVPPTAEDWLRFGWDTFIAMNWPHLEGGNPGQPDSSRDIVTSYNSPRELPRYSLVDLQRKIPVVLQLPIRWTTAYPRRAQSW